MRPWIRKRQLPALRLVPSDMAINPSCEPAYFGVPVSDAAETSVSFLRGLGTIYNQHIQHEQKWSECIDFSAAHAMSHELRSRLTDTGSKLAVMRLSWVSVSSDQGNSPPQSGWHCDFTMGDTLGHMVIYFIFAWNPSRHREIIREVSLTQPVSVWSIDHSHYACNRKCLLPGLVAVSFPPKLTPVSPHSHLCFREPDCTVYYEITPHAFLGVSGQCGKQGDRCYTVKKQLLLLVAIVAAKICSLCSETTRDYSACPTDHREHGVGGIRSRSLVCLLLQICLNGFCLKTNLIWYLKSLQVIFINNVLKVCITLFVKNFLSVHWKFSAAAFMLSQFLGSMYINVLFVTSHPPHPSAPPASFLLGP